ncbi:hypothetical protein EJP82_11320 [Paenibacillus anaericanus]|uniref:Uncharacterized protein n=1 Tax=Paenibacillus anaericanus TaxID=170367 RepID=A0A3S1C997_9BACL|nr:hypothetical protein [Paenibacillus anaericanus]RUT46436.1 hypothetical protein EJP82_11320 [Paenibacillus anaericanus]
MSDNEIYELDVEIDSRDIDKTAKKLRSLDKLLQQTQRRATVFGKTKMAPKATLDDRVTPKVTRIRDNLMKLDRMRVTPVATLIDHVSSNVGGIRASLASLTQTRWSVAVDGVSWNTVIGKSFDDWMGSEGQTTLKKISSAIGTALGNGLRGFIMQALGLVDTPKEVKYTRVVDYLEKGSNPLEEESPYAEAGRLAGETFFESFLSALDPDQIASKLGNIEWNNSGGDGGGGDTGGWSKVLEIVEDVAVGVVTNLASDKIGDFTRKRRRQKRKEKSSNPSNGSGDSNDDPTKSSSRKKVEDSKKTKTPANPSSPDKTKQPSLWEKIKGRVSSNKTKAEESKPKIPEKSPAIPSSSDKIKQPSLWEKIKGRVSSNKTKAEESKPKIPEKSPAIPSSSDKIKQPSLWEKIKGRVSSNKTKAEESKPKIPEKSPAIPSSSDKIKQPSLWEKIKGRVSSNKTKAEESKPKIPEKSPAIPSSSDKIKQPSLWEKIKGRVSSNKIKAEESKTKTLEKSPANPSSPDKTKIKTTRPNWWQKVKDGASNSSKWVGENIKKLPKKGNGLTKLLGKSSKFIKMPGPLSLLMGVGNIATAGSKKDKFKAAASTILGGVGGVIGGALGTFVAPGIGTGVGAVAGSSGGDMLGEKLGGKIYEWIYGKEEPVKVKPSESSMKKIAEKPDFNAMKSDRISDRQDFLSVGPELNAPIYNLMEYGNGTSLQQKDTSNNFYISDGAVNLTVQKDEIDYDQIANMAGLQFANAVKHSMQNLKE